MEEKRLKINAGETGVLVSTRGASKTMLKENINVFQIQWLLPYSPAFKRTLNKGASANNRILAYFAKHHDKIFTKNVLEKQAL